MKEKIINKLEQIAFAIINIIILLASIYIGSNIKEPIYIIQIIATTFTTVYLIIKKILGEKQVIIKGKIDIYILLFITSTLIPLFAKTFASLNDTYQFILKYISLYSVYILARNVLNKKRISILSNTIILTSLIPIIFGIDKLTYNFFESFLKQINAVNVTSDRLVSTFGYPNTFAIYLSITMFLAIDKYKVSEKKCIKVLYVVYVIITLISILLTQSKAVIFLLLFILLLLILKGIKEKKITLNMILIGICIFIVFLNYFIIAIQIPKDLEITGKEKICVIKNIEKNKEYEYTFTIEAESLKSYNVFEIEIVEVNRYLHDKVLEKMAFTSFKGQKTLKIKTSDIASYIEIRIKNKLCEKLVISKLLINNEEHVLEYKYIKDEFVRLFKDFNFKYSSVWQRGDFIKNGIEIIKDNWLLGTGGNAWRNLYQQYQDYLYGAQEAHSYPIEVWSSFGLLGIVSYFMIVISCIRKVYLILKQKNKEGANYKVATSIGLILLLIHSLIDFDLSFLIMLILFFIMISIIHNDDVIEIKNKNMAEIIIKVIEIFITILITITAIENIKTFSTQIFIKDNTYKIQTVINKTDENFLKNRIEYLLEKNDNRQDVINEVKRYIYQESYKHQNKMYQIVLETIVKDINSNNLSERIEDIESVKQMMQNKKRSATYNIVQIKDRANIMIDFARNIQKKAQEIKSKKLNEISKQFYEMILNEYSENIEIIKDYEKHGEFESVVEMKVESYNSLYDDAINEMNNIDL